MRTIISFTALLVSVGLMQLANGALGPLDALSGIYFSFSSFQIGIAHIILIVFGVIRMTSRPSPNVKTPYSYIARTSFVLEKITGRRGHRDE